MARLGHNVNVMDDRGVIIGSGDPTRLGHTHAGALRAIGTRDRVVVHEGESLEGALPGVNLPLLLEGEVLGAVGVTGDPDQLSDVADLLAMTAELIVAQVRAQGERDWRTRQRERLVMVLVDPASATTGADRLAEDLGVDLTVPRVAVLVSLPRGDLRRAQQSVDRADAGILTAIAGREELLALVPGPGSGTDGVAERLARALPAGSRCRLHVGGRFDHAGPLAAAFSARSAEDVRDLRRGAEGTLHHFDDDATAALVHGLEDDWRADELGRPWQRLAAADPHEVLRTTVLAVLARDGDLAACAQDLSVHRNTLRYRLEKVHEVSGCDVRRALGALRLYVGAVRSGHVVPDVVHVHQERTSTSG